MACGTPGTSWGCVLMCFLCAPKPPCCRWHTGGIILPVCIPPLPSFADQHDTRFNVSENKGLRSGSNLSNSTVKFVAGTHSSMRNRFGICILNDPLNLVQFSPLIFHHVKCLSTGRDFVSPSAAQQPQNALSRTNPELSSPETLLISSSLKASSSPLPPK